MKFGRTIYIPYNKLLVISGDNVDESEPVHDTFVFDLMANTVERMPDIRLSRTSFAAHYDFGDRYVYVLGGSNRDGKMVKECEKFDVFNQKWIEMPKLNIERGNPGTFISEDRRYLYAFQGFRNIQQAGGPAGIKQSEALDTVERLDLWNEQAGWEVHTMSSVYGAVGRPLRAKGCFVMYSLGQFDFSQIKAAEQSSLLPLGSDKYEEEKEDMQIDSSPGLKKQKWNNDPELFHKNAAKYGLRDKAILFGGWHPYENLPDVEAFDAKRNQLEDILPLAQRMRGERIPKKAA